MPGAIIYKGPSMLDGAPIISVATWRRTNAESDDVLQTYVMRSDMDPREASKTGADASICGDCRHRGTPTLNPAHVQAVGRSCHLNMGQGPLRVWRAYTANKYLRFDSPRLRAVIGMGRAVRIGTYGNPAAVPDTVWRDLLIMAGVQTSYMRNDAEPAPCMVSAASLTQTRV